MPDPLPWVATVSVCWFSANVAVTSAAALTVTVHGAVPLHVPSPLQPVNVESPVAAAVSVTIVPGEYASSQSPGQSIPVGLEVTVPVPLPPSVTTIELSSANAACTVTSAARSDSVQSPVPVQPPPV